LRCVLAELLAELKTVAVGKIAVENVRSGKPRANRPRAWKAVAAARTW
jgi:hypothetical protein